VIVTPALSFLAAQRLFALALPIAVGAGYLVAQIRRRGVVTRFTNLELLDAVAPDRPRWRRHLPAVGALLGLVVLVLAFARPAIAQQVTDESAVVMLAIDSSLSMSADDVSPDRLTAAQDAADAFLADVPEGVRVGLVTFDQTARVVVPPTDDPSEVQDAIDSIRLGEGTAIGDAIITSLDALASLDEETEASDASSSQTSSPEPADGDGAAVVLLSDGATTHGEPDDAAAQAAAEQGVPVTTIAFGTDAGEVTAPDGQVIPVPVDRDALRAIADTAGGQFFSAESADDLTSVYEEIGTTVTHDTEEREVTDLFVGIALGVLALAVVGSIVWAGRVP
jgi:Ca-activated chloride channel family protein